MPLERPQPQHGGIFPQSRLLVIDQCPGGTDVKHPQSRLLVGETSRKHWKDGGFGLSARGGGKDNAVVSIQDGGGSQLLHRPQTAPAKAVNDFFLQQRVKAGECAHCLFPRFSVL